MSPRAVSVLRKHDDQVIPTAGVYEIDPVHTAVEFVARHMMITKVRGRFADVRGQITIAETPALSHVEAVIGAASVDTGNRERDGVLRAADLFDVEHYPTISFRSTSVRPLPDKAWEVVGDLTIRDATRQVAFRVDFDGADILFGVERIGLTASTEVNREDFGLTWNEVLETGGVLIGKTVRIELEIQAIPTSSAAAA